jgi:hypothetical protein
MLRKHLLTERPATPNPRSGELDIAALATVFVTSEAADHPIDYVFDAQRGPGGSRWIAAAPGEQVILLAFDTAQTLHRVTLEIEERDVSRTQELALSVSCDGGQTYRELRRQEYTFSPPGTTFEREDWAITAERITHLQVRIKPDKGDKPCQATLTSLVVQ